nr:uncharacterized protein LOC109169545 [Ipomoea batatas]
MTISTGEDDVRYRTGFSLIFQGNGCGFFLYVEDIMQGLGAIEYESTKVDVMDCKKIFESVRDEVMVIQQRLGRIEEAMKNMNRSGHLNSVNVVKVVALSSVLTSVASSFTSSDSSFTSSPTLCLPSFGSSPTIPSFGSSPSIPSFGSSDTLPSVGSPHPVRSSTDASFHKTLSLFNGSWSAL